MGCRTALCGNPLEEILGYGLIFPFEWFDENDAAVWLGFLCVEALDAHRHCDCVLDELRHNCCGREAV